MDIQTVAFDPGFQFTKGYSAGGKYMCLARVKEVADSEVPDGGAALVEFQGKKYRVGDGLNVPPDLHHDKTQSMKTKIEMLNYLHQLCEGEKGKFLVVTGTPLSKSHTETNLSRALLDYLGTGGQYAKVTRDGIVKEIMVEKAVSMPQAMIAYYTLPQEEREKYQQKQATVLIWDLGGHTFDVAEFRGGIPQKEPETKLYTRNLGIIPMLITFRKKLDSKYPTLNFSSIEELRRIFEQGFFPTPAGSEDVSELAAQVGREHVYELVQDMENVFSPSTADENILCGGGFISLGSYMRELFPRCILMEDAQFSNVRAMYKTLVNQAILPKLVTGCA
ncbi:ParM/StbA family protein [Syntrophomonas curvata]